jgi:hypothetical protein
MEWGRNEGKVARREEIGVGGERMCESKTAEFVD